MALSLSLYVYIHTLTERGTIYAERERECRAEAGAQEQQEKKSSIFTVGQTSAGLELLDGGGLLRLKILAPRARALLLLQQLSLQRLDLPLARHLVLHLAQIHHDLGTSGRGLEDVISNIESYGETEGFFVATAITSDDECNGFQTAIVVKYDT